MAYELIRPLHLYGLWFARSFAMRLAPTTLRCLPIFIIAGWFLDLSAPISWEAGIAFGFSIVLALFLGAAITTLMVISLFWTLSGEGVQRLLPHVSVLFAGIVVPLPLFPKWIQPFLNIQPFRGIMDIPSRLYTGVIPTVDAPFYLGFQLVWILLIIFFGQWLMKRRRGNLSFKGARMMTLFCKLISVSIRSQMQYPSSFLMLSVAYFVGTFIDILGIWVLFDRFQMVKGWTLYEVGIIYGIIHMGFSIAETFARGFDTFGQMIKQGDFDRLLLRPISPLMQVAAREIHIMRIGRFLQGLIVLIWSAAHLSFSLFSIHALVIFFSILSTASLFYGLLIIQSNHLILDH